MRSLISNPNIDNSDPSNYPSGRIKDNSGIGDGTAVNERTKGDLHQFFEKLMLLAGIAPNNLPDNETNGYQLIDAMIALASKNDYIQQLNTSGGVLQIPIKVSLMEDGESLVCKASADKTSETTIKGSDNSVTAVTFFGNFKANEYVRFIKTVLGVTLIRIGDNVSLNSMVSELLFLKKASYAQELAGALDTVATTPQTNALVFTERINGASSSVSLANASRNGLLSKELFTTISNLTSIEVNYGTFTGANFDDDAVGTFYPRTGDVASAQKIQNTNHGGLIEVTFTHNHTDYNNIQLIYGIKFITNYEQANDMHPLVWDSVAPNKIRIYIERPGGLATVQFQLQTNQR